MLATIAALLCAVPATTTAACGPSTSTLEVVQAQGTNMAGKLVVITGGDSGIGYQIALALAQANASIVILSYDAERKGKAAAQNITRATNNTAIDAQQLDLSSFASVRTGAAAVVKKYPVIDFLICDAGISNNPSSLPPVTDDGFERVVQVNYLGHFLLIDMLLPALRKSGAGRVLLTSSLSAFKFTCVGDRGCTDIERLQELVHTPPKVLPHTTGAGNYGLSKFMVVYLARELAVRETGPVSFYSSRPGLVGGTGITTGHKIEEKVLCETEFAGMHPCPIPVENGGATPAYLITTPSLANADNGKLFFFCATIPPPTGAENGGTAWTAATQAKLFDLSRNWTAV